MTEFIYKSLEEVSTRIKVGFVGSVNEFYCSRDIGVPIIRTTDIDDLDLNKVKFVTKEFHEKNKKSQLKKGDLIIARHGENGNAVIYKGGGAAQVLNAVIIEPDQNQVGSELLKIFFDSPFIKKQISGSVKGSVQGVINTKHVSDLLVNIGQNIDYDFVTVTITNIDKKIELNNKINTELEAMAKLIYDYWFVQFDFPDANGKPYKSSGGKMVYNETLKREIPEGWEEKKLGDVVKTSLGGTPSTKVQEYWDNAEIPWLNSGEVARFPALDSDERVTQMGIYNSAAELMPKGSVIISIVRHIRVSILAIDAAFNQSVVGLYETGTLKGGFLYPFLCHDIPRLMSLRTGAQQPHINKGIVDDSYIVMPPDDVLKYYYEVVEPIFEKINISAMESKKLEQLRDWLLPMLMNGQVTIKDA